MKTWPGGPAIEFDPKVGDIITVWVHTGEGLNAERTQVAHRVTGWDEQGRLLAVEVEPVVTYREVRRFRCPTCRERFRQGRSDQRYCSGRCRAKASRERRSH